MSGNPRTSMIQTKSIIGDWGGDHISMNITASDARIEFDCASAEISRGIAVGKAGRFSVAGTYIQEAGGPTRMNQPAVGIPVTFIGRVRSGKMTLEVRRKAGGNLIGKFSLRKGQSPELTKCR